MELILWNNWDLVTADERTFKTVEDAQEARKEYKKRFEHQGFYRDSTGNHVDIDQIMEHILVRPADLRWIFISKNASVPGKAETLVIEGITYLNAKGGAV